MGFINKYFTCKKIYRIYIFLSLIIANFFVVSASADMMTDRMSYWESKAFLCAGSGGVFPSKANGIPPTTCDSGDMTLFNGLLCASGDKRGCDGVKNAQDSNGRWWRSPANIGKEAPEYDVSFSPDMARGVFLYVVTTKDINAFRKWLIWINESRPCLLNLGGNCYFQGWPRLCKDDAQDKRCTFRPQTCGDIELVGKYLGVTEADICRRVLKSFQIRDDYIIPQTELAFGGALINDPGFPMHLAAAEIFLIDKLGQTSIYSRAGSIALAVREPKNPFFLYLAEGPTTKVKELTLKLCPAVGETPHEQHQWAWEREASEKAWEKSMYWDCIFMGKLLGY